VVSAIGEVRSWWGLVGQTGITVGSTVSILVGLGTYLFGAGRSQVADVHEAVRDNGSTLSSMDGRLDKLDRLDAIDHDLDRVQVALDDQTGVLDRQATILEEIRDRPRPARPQRSTAPLFSPTGP